MTREEREEEIKELTAFKDKSWDGMPEEVIDVAIEALEQQPCEDCISRQAVIDVTWEEPSYTDALNVLTEVRDKVKVLPSVTPQQKIGHWIYFKAVNTSEIIWSECSECKDGERGCAKRMKYCPTCGAKMQEVEE